MNVYAQCPVRENERFWLRLVGEGDCADLLKVYSDTAAVPLFNSDNCNGDDFHYTTRERMQQAIQFWIWSYENGWFVRWSIIDKAAGQAVGTIELFRRDSENGDGGCGVLRLDLRSDYEREREIRQILSLVIPDAFGWFGCDSIITKAKPIAQQRIGMLTKMGFVPSDEPLVCHDGTCCGDYWTLREGKAKS